MNDTNDPFRSYQPQSETENLGTLQVFDCESIPIPPGTKADPRRKQRPVRVPPSWWYAVAVIVLAALIVGWLIGRAW